MSGISSIPPLLCNTPPPMDFGDEEEEADSELPNDISLDDEELSAYNAFSLPQTNLDGTNSNVPPLIESPVGLNCTTEKLPKTTTNLHNSSIENDVSVKKCARPVEAFNLALSPAMLGSNSPPPMEFSSETAIAFAHRYDGKDENEEELEDNCIIPTIPCDSQNTRIEDDEEFEEIDCLKNEDNISLPSLKFDTLSINSDNISGSSPTPNSNFREIATEECENKEDCKEKSQDGDSRSSSRTLPRLPDDFVKVEDVSDDSSDEETNSPTRKNISYIDENAVDFFAIHTVQSQPDPINIETIVSKDLNKTNIVDTQLSKEYERNADVAEGIRELDKDLLEKNDDFDSFTDFTAFQTPTDQLPSTKVYQDITQQAQSSEFDADFGDFVTTTCVSSDEVEATELKLEMPKSNVQSFDSREDDDFEEFQDFTAVSSVQHFAKEEGGQPENVSHANDTDDEFGEFTDVAASSMAATESPANIILSSTANKQNIKDRLNSILNMMFPSVSVDSPAPIDNVKLNCGVNASEHSFELGAIEAAKALEYQWTKSEVRHSLIRSLGIDSRNILFGEKWNSSMPRYATSLKPLEPLKPQQVGSISNDGTNSNNKDRSGNVLKPDVPAVEFDWNSSGLVNPLDGPEEDLHKGETKTIHTSQFGSVNEPIDEQQPSHSAYTANVSIDKLTDNINNNNATSATPTALNAAATAALSSNVPTDSIGYNINDIAYNTDIGISKPSTGQRPIGVANSKTKVATIQQQQQQQHSTNTDLSYNLAKTLSSNKVVPEIIDDEVVATSTFAGPLKETHIYTPSKIDGTIASKSGASSSNKSTVDIDFDYEIAAAGIIIDETVVKKEYRDIEYNPGFSLDIIKTLPSDLLTDSDKPTINNEIFGSLQDELSTSTECNHAGSRNNSEPTIDVNAVEIDDEFSDFQSVPPSNLGLVSNIPIESFKRDPESSAAVAPRSRDLVSGEKSSRTSTPTFGGREMILSPAILLPQAISIESNKPKIEWGESVASINPEELARIEELFPQPKSDSTKKTPPMVNGYQNQISNSSLSISATIAKKELQVDDDDWSEFVSVPAAPELFVQHKVPLQVQSQKNISSNNNNNNNQASTHVHKQQQRQQTNVQSGVQVEKPIGSTVASAEEEWSDFVSSAPPTHVMPYRAMPQFNSAAWKNANFYNNPLSFYQSRTQTQIHSNSVPKLHHHNNNSDAHLSYNNNYSKYNQPQRQLHYNRYAQQQLQQQIHVMQDFSTAPPSPHRIANAAPVPNHNASNAQFQVGSAKVAPSISLIPDLGFIAPAAATHTAFINTLPKPSIITKK